MRGKENQHHGNYSDDNLHPFGQLFGHDINEHSWVGKELNSDEIKITGVLSERRGRTYKPDLSMICLLRRCKR